MNHDALDVILILLVVSVIAVAIFRRFQLPPILAYLFVGIVAGPHGLGWIPDSENTRFLAEFGIVFLLFTVGLEFSLPQMVAMRREVLTLGGAQVVLTALVAGLAAWLFGMSIQGAVVVGGVLAMSSTAIVIKQLTEQLEVSSRHGRNSIGVLLFQDIAVVPFLIVIPVLLGDSDVSITLGLGWAMVKGVVVIGVMLAMGHWLLRPLFHEIASRRSSELFTLTALLFALAAAWITQISGLSLALGAFLAGMMLGETEFRHQVEADIRPFRDVLLGLFFVTIGMLLDVFSLPHIIHWVLLLIVAIVVFKIISIMILCRLMGTSKGVSLRTGLVLAQSGEFGLALLALGAGLMGDASSQIILAAMIGTMILSPLIISYNGPFAKWIYPGSYLGHRLKNTHEMAESAKDLDSHVIICGYGRIGQNIAHFIENEGFDYIAMDLDPVCVRDARSAGQRVNYGDSTHRENLEAAGLYFAKVLVVTFDDIKSSIKILEQVRNMRPEMPVLIRTRDDTNLDRLQQAGATEVVPETLEASLMLVSHLLLLMGVPVSRIVRNVQKTRDNRYQMLREFFHGEDTESIDESSAFRERLGSVTLTQSANAIGKTLRDINLRDSGVVVTAVRRSGILGHHPEPGIELREGDTLVLYGYPEDLEHAEELLLKG